MLNLAMKVEDLSKRYRIGSREPCKIPLIVVLIKYNG
jgi:hypothetical protein